MTSAFINVSQPALRDQEQTKRSVVCTDFCCVSAPQWSSSVCSQVISKSGVEKGDAQLTFLRQHEVGQGSAECGARTVGQTDKKQ